MNSCELYIRLAPHQFDSELAQITWTYSYMKSGRAALFVDRALRYETKYKFPRYTTWDAFHTAFVEEFFPKNERQRALTRLETSAYHQNKRSMDEYVDEFKDLVDLSGYSEGLAIVMKFRKGLRRDVQDQIAQLARGRPDDADPNAWYEAALACAENIEANTLFHGASRNPTTTSSFRTFASIPVAPAPPRFQQFTPPARVPQNPVPMEIDAARSKAPVPETCYRCGETGHRKFQCPRRFDIRHMTMDECDEWWQGRARAEDAKEVAHKEEEARVEEEGAEDFQTCSE